MEKIIRIILFITLATIGVKSHAQIDDSTFVIFESMNDSVDLSENFYDLYDSLNFEDHPGDGLYKNWNTTMIKYRQSDTISRIDSTMIILVNPGMGQNYFHPHNGIVTSHFGWRGRRFHYGTDVDLETGEQVMAAFDGMVRIRTYDGGFGNVVVIRHPNGLETVYAHLSAIFVDTNQVVKAGDVIGLGGNTGRSRGSHLHFEVRYLGSAMNAETIIDFKNQKLISDTLYLTKKNFEYLKTVQSNQNSSKGAVYYTVKKGDTLGKIAQKNKTTVAKLCNLNGIRENKLLQIGQKVRVR